MVLSDAFLAFDEDIDRESSDEEEDIGDDDEGSEFEVGR